MNKKLISGLILATSLAFFWNCSSDSSGGVSCDNADCSEVNKEFADYNVTDTCYLLPGEINLLIYLNGNVTDIDGNTVGSFDASTGTITKNDGSVIENIVLDELTKITPDMVEQAKEEVGKENNSDGNTGKDQGNGQTNQSNSSQTNPSSQDNGSSASGTSSPAGSSSSGNPKLDDNGFPTIESYGAPPAEYTKDILNNNQTGWNSRYWDACKPHCSWISDGQEGKTDTTTQESYVAGMTTARNCNIHDVEVPTFTLGHAVQKYWFGYEGTNSACGTAKEKGVFTCTDMAPIQVTENLSYAYVAGPASQTTCGKCFHLQYNGSFKDAKENNLPKATHQALKGKHMVVMTSNIGHDVENGQFDLMVPGGGVGAYDALSVQVNGANVNWGAGFGGFLTECQKREICGFDGSLECYQNCVNKMCDDAFGNAGYPNLLRGCHWFADWFMAADNPTYNWEEVECPQYLIDHYMTRINTTKDNNYKWHDDWSTYKKGDKLETLNCWKDGENPHDPNGTGAGCDN